MSHTQRHPEELIEEGEAFRALHEERTKVSDDPNVRRKDPAAAKGKRERFDVIVIGAGQAGLSVGYYLARQGLRFVVLDANERVGDTWRKRWDSLRLFTPAKFNGLAGMRFPAPPNYFPTKNEMADYLERYVAHFKLPVRCGVHVDELSHTDGRYRVRTGRQELEADHVVVAMANFQKSKVPAFAKELRPDIRQLHSVDYRNPSQVREGAVLLVGAGNSGSEIALELARHGHETWMSGRNTGEVPFRPSGLLGRLLLVRLVLRVVYHRLLTVNTPMGRKARPKLVSQGGPRIRVKSRDLASVGVQCVPRMAGVQNGLPVLEDGRVLDVANVVWCTGYDPGFSWIHLPVFDEDGEPRHDAGRVPSQPGLYFVGLHFLYSMSSAMVHGAPRDAERIVNAITAAREQVAQAV